MKKHNSDVFDEFTLIEQYFNTPTPHRSDVVLGIGDDCALLTPPDKQLLAMSTDTLVAGIHFTDNTPPHAIGHKALAVSLSDLAAMAAQPAWIMLSLTLPAINEAWVAEFCRGFFALLHSYQLQLVGGNTTRGSLSITTHATGFVHPRHSVTRHNAQVGDDIYVTGTLGDAGLGLQLIQHDANLPDLPHALRDFAIGRLYYPDPRIDIGLALGSIAHAMIDISDGLAADASHILHQSAVGAVLYAEKLPLSNALQHLDPLVAWRLALSAGDDYELCFTAAPDKREKLETLFASLDCHYTCIGRIESTPGLRVTYDNGRLLSLPQHGFNHFNEK